MRYVITIDSLVCKVTIFNKYTGNEIENVFPDLESMYKFVAEINAKLINSDLE